MKKTFPRVRALLQAEVKKFDSVNQVAIKTGLTNNTIGKYLEGTSEPTTATLFKLSEYFKKPVAWLRGDSDDDTAPHAVVTSDMIDLTSLSPEMRAVWDALDRIPVEKLKKVLAILDIAERDD